MTALPHQPNTSTSDSAGPGVEYGRLLLDAAGGALSTFSAVLSLPGCVVTADPAVAGRLVAIDVDDPGQAAGTVRALLGAGRDPRPGAGPGLPPDTAGVLHELGLMAEQARGDLAATRTGLEQAAQVLHRRGALVGAGDCAWDLGRVLAAGGETEQARLQLQAAVARYQQAGDDWRSVRARRALAALARGQTSTREPAQKTAAVLLHRPVFVVDRLVAGRLWRLALLGWVGQFCPVPLDSGLLAVEAGLLAGQLADAGCAGMTGLTGPAFHLGADRLLEMAGRLRAGSLPHPLASTVREAVGVAVRWMDPADQRWQARVDVDVDAAVLAGASPAGGGAASDPAGADEVWRWWHQTALAESAVPAGASLQAAPTTAGTAGMAGTASVDWRQVPAGVLDPAEDTVAFSVGDNRQLTVTVAAAGPQASVGRAGEGELRFRVLTTDGNTSASATGAGDGAGDGVLADSRLRYDVERGVYTGRVLLPRRVLEPADETEAAGGGAATGVGRGGLTVDVYSIASTHRPARGVEATRAKAHRHAARALTFTRLANAAHDEGHTGSGGSGDAGTRDAGSEWLGRAVLELAAQDWLRAAQTTPPGDLGSRAGCTARYVAVLERLGSPRARRESEALVSLPAAPTPDPDPAVGGPLLAELARMGRL